MKDLNKGLMVLAMASIAGTMALPVYAYEHRAGGWHPRRHEVMGRDRNMGRQIYRDRGQFHGNYKSLVGQDRAIKTQERADVKANGGFLTKPEQKQLNKEENGLRKDIHQDR